jgi:LysR family glycine cleavage system transcriptional activator
LLYPGLHAAFLQIRQSVDLLDRDVSERILVISAPPGFTAKWLAPRLYRFLIAHPEIDARISASKELANFTTDGVDVAIRNGRTNAAGLWSRRLMGIHVTPVASPKLVAELGLKRPEDLQRAPLIHDDLLGLLPGTPTWLEWLEAAGVAGVDLSRGLRFNSPDHALEAAGEGAGVLLAQLELAHDDLRTGRLVAPFELTLAAERSFMIVCPDGFEKRPKIRVFYEWLQAEVTRMESEMHQLQSRERV